MSERPLYDLTATEIADGIAEGGLDAREVVDCFLGRIEAREPDLQAWAFVDADGARSAVALCETEARAGRRRGPLHGVPVGIKDVFHVEDMPTVANSKTLDAAPRYPDSGIAAALRQAGAIVVGKCATVEFAGMGEPPETRNPWNTLHTAGGSSSGSGAAVGARMVPFAIGTQTGGSNLRPAAYCGVAGFKPTYAATSRAGLLPVSWSLDHPGIIARSAADLALVFSAIARHAPAPSRPASQLRFGLLKRFFLEKSEPAVVDAVERAAAALAQSGHALRSLDVPPLFDAQQAVHRLIMNIEMANYHAPRQAEQSALMSERHRLAVEAYALVPASYYVQALRVRRMIRDAMAALFDSVDILLMPTTPAPAPEGLSSTGDASLLSPWSLVGFPSITIPCGLSPNGLPLGLQLVGAPHADAQVLAAAETSERLIGRLDLPA